MDDRDSENVRKAHGRHSQRAFDANDDDPFRRFERFAVDFVHVVSSEARHNREKKEARRRESSEERGREVRSHATFEAVSEMRAYGESKF